MNMPQHAFAACDVVEVYLHRGTFEPVLSDEDQEIDPDRWCSHSAWGSALQTALVLLYNGRAPDVVCVCTTSEESEREGDADP